MKVGQGLLALLVGHATAVAAAWFAGRGSPLDFSAPVMAALGGVQLVYGVPLALWSWRRRRPMSYGVLLGMLATAAMSAAALRL